MSVYRSGFKGKVLIIFLLYNVRRTWTDVLVKLFQTKKDRIFIYTLNLLYLSSFFKRIPKYGFCY